MSGSPHELSILHHMAEFSTILTKFRDGRNLYHIYPDPELGGGRTQMAPLLKIGGCGGYERATEELVPLK